MGKGTWEWRIRLWPAATPNHRYLRLVLGLKPCNKREKLALENDDYSSRKAILIGHSFAGDVGNLNYWPYWNLTPRFQALRKSGLLIITAARLAIELTPPRAHSELAAHSPRSYLRNPTMLLFSKGRAFYCLPPTKKIFPLTCKADQKKRPF